jgi:hypothetical protein
MLVCISIIHGVGFLHLCYCSLDECRLIGETLFALHAHVWLSILTVLKPLLKQILDLFLHVQLILCLLLLNQSQLTRCLVQLDPQSVVL